MGRTKKRASSPLTQAMDDFGGPADRPAPQVVYTRGAGAVPGDGGGPQILSHADVMASQGPMTPEGRAALDAADEERRALGYETASEEAMRRSVNPWVGYDV